MKKIKEEPKDDTTRLQIKYFVTPRPGNWLDSEKMCEGKGGNLIFDSLKSKGGLKRFLLIFP